MVEFVTLFLGLVVGPHPVELMAEGSVAAIELRLDGEAVATLDKPPWRALVDFGSELAPHQLEAVALDGDGQPAHRIVQEVNRPRPEAEAAVLIERDAEGRPAAARVTWQTVSEMWPIVAAVTLDGEPLEVASLERFPLPGSDGDEFHFLQVDLEFAGGISAHTQAVYGGEYVDEASGELTAVPVVFTGKRKTARPAQLGAWFLRQNAPQRVVAVEKGSAEVIVVRAAGVQELVAGLEGQADGIGSTVVSSGAGVSSLDSLGVGATAGAGERARVALPLEPRDILRLMLPRSREIRYDRVTHRAFVISPRFSRQDGGLFWALTQGYYLEGVSESERIADAVAVAGMRAAWGNRRRAVVLALGDDAPDLSVLSPKAVQTYLRTLDVPLSVWQFGSEGSAGAGARVEEWPEPERIASFRDLRRATRKLQRDLDEQRIVWLDGAHPPESIRLAEGAQAERVGDYQ